MIIETWFNVLSILLSGCHADIGGGSHEDDVDASLSNITLRWMIRECYLAKTNIRFDEGLLDDLGLALQDLESNPQGVQTFDIPGTDPMGPPDQATSLVQSPAKDTMDAVAKIYNQLFMQKFWWVLELVPMLSTHQRGDGSWLRSRLSVFSGF